MVNIGVQRFICGLAGFVVCLYLLILKIMGQAIGGWPLLIFGVLLIILGVQMFSIGFIGDMLGMLLTERDMMKAI